MISYCNKTSHRVVCKICSTDQINCYIYFFTNTYYLFVSLFDSVSVIKTKLQSFRTQFGKERNMVEKSKKSGAGVDDVYTPRYEFYDMLTFLRPVISKRPSTTNLVRILYTAVQ